MTKRILFSTLLILASCSFGLLLAEGFVRLFDPYARQTTSGGLFVMDDHLGWKLAAGRDSTHTSPHFEIHYAINTLGFRDKPRTTLKAPMTYRILVYGDSQIFGWGIPQEQRFSNLIENQRSDLEVWNLGVPGYGLDQEVLAYEQSGNTFNADAVIFYISGATVSRVHDAFIHNKYKPQFVMASDGSLSFKAIPIAKNRALGLFHKILSPFSLPYFLQRRLVMLRESQRKFSHQNFDKIPAKDPIPDGSIGLLAQTILSKAHILAQERHHRMSVLSALPKFFREDVRVFCKKKGLPLFEISLDPTDPSLIFGSDDRHWTSHAHQLITEQLPFQIESGKRGEEGAPSFHYPSTLQPVAMSPE